MPLDPRYVAYSALNPDEQSKIDDCFVSGTFGAGTFWVVFSRNPELHHVLGVYTSEAAAVAALRAGPTPDLRWTAADKAAIAYTSTTVAALGSKSSAPLAQNSLFVVAHPCWTEQAICEVVSGGSALRRHPVQEDIGAIELRVTVRGSTAPIVYRVNPMSDAIALTAGGWEVFSAPHYRATFGNRFLAALRRYLRDSADSMLRDIKD